MEDLPETAMGVNQRAAESAASRQCANADQSLINDPLIGQILLRQASLTERQLADALAAQRAQQARQKLGRILVEGGVVSESDVLRAVAQQYGVPYIERISVEQSGRAILTGLRLEFLHKRSLLPFRDGDGKVLIAMADPLDVEAFDTVANVLQEPCRRAACPVAAIEDALSHCYYQDDASASQALDELDVNHDIARISMSAKAEDLLDLAQRAPIIKLVNTVLFQAVRSRASDVHVEPYEQELKIRFRIDGVLHDRLSAPSQYAAALASRLKIMASLDIAEHRLPQDGRTRIKIGDKEVDIRVSTIPTSAGERVVLRLLDATTARRSLGELGFPPEGERQFRRLIQMSHGIILLTGPTGSGKTTTLYAALSELNTEELNILTVEDPIEYRLTGVGQMQVQPKVELTFANSLRHILRQDPDVIMVGEIRDLETAEIAIRAALTGHLVFSTLHTNDSASAVTRLLDMDIEPYLVSSSVMAIIAQRLVRVICPECKCAYTPSEGVLATLGVDAGQGAIELCRGTGCAECLGTGYRGRTGIFEMLLVDEEIRGLVMERAGSNIIKQCAIARGLRTLRQDGVQKVLAGLTTVEEVLRVTQDEAIGYEE